VNRRTVAGTRGAFGFSILDFRFAIAKRMAAENYLAIANRKSAIANIYVRTGQ